MVVEQCRVCGSTGPFTTCEARERRFDDREFLYAECGACGSLLRGSTSDAGPDLAAYPDAYFHFDAPQGRMRRMLETARDRHAIGESSVIGPFVETLQRRSTEAADMIGLRAPGSACRAKRKVPSEAGSPPLAPEDVPPEPQADNTSVSPAAAASVG